MAAIASSAVLGTTVQPQWQSNQPLQAGDFNMSLTVGGYNRHYVVHVPASYAGSPIPLVIMLHGAGGNGAQTIEDYKWLTASDSNGFIVVGPDALPVNPQRPESLLLNPSVWRDGSGRVSTVGQPVDDGAFVSAILDKMQTSAAIDPLRIYIAGHSSGAGMSYLLGVQLSGQIAAIAAVSGHLWLTDPLTVSYPVSLLLIDGTLDPLNPPGGGTVKMPWGNIETKPPILQSFNRWAKLLNCAGTPDPFDNHNRVSGLAYHSCDAGSEAVYYQIDGMGHVWPGGRNLLPEHLVGPNSNAIDATSTIWSFFQNHPRTIPPMVMTPTPNR